MLSTRWQKVIIDLWNNRARTVIVALAIAVGVYSVGVVVDAREMLVREYNNDKNRAMIASAIINTQPFDEDLARQVAHLPGVAAAEGRSIARVRVYLPSGEPRDLLLVAIPEFTNMQVDAVTPLQGKWPPAKGEVLLEHLAFSYVGAQMGKDVSVEIAPGQVRTLTVVGSVHDSQQFSPNMAGVAVGYVTRETMDGLGLPSTFSELRIRVTEPAHDKAHILSVLSEVQDYLKRSGRTVLSQQVITKSPADPFINTVVLILTSLGLFILVLSGFLVVNAMTALITQQIPQIGVMKLIGGRRRQIIGLYLVMVLAYGLLAIAVAIPLAMLTARLLMTAMVEPLLNVMPEGYAVPFPLIAVQAAVGLLLPLLSGLAPVVRGTGITTQRALNDTGLPAGKRRRGKMDRLLSRLQQRWPIKRPLLLSVRNTFRHKGRLVQTLIVMIFGTALFISVLSVQTSVNATLNDFMRFHQYDVGVELNQPQRIQRLEEIARQVPGVVDVQVWSTDNASIKLPDGTKSDPFTVNAVPAVTSYVDPKPRSGQWLPAGADLLPNGLPLNPIVVNSDLVDQQPNVHVGSALVLNMDGRDSTWHVIGIVPTESRGAAVYVRYDDYAYATRTPGRGTYVAVETNRHDAQSQHEMAITLFQRFEDSKINVAGTQTTQVMRSEHQLLFTVIVAFLVLMALLLAAVGGLGLASTMSINMLERVREIGVLRAIGASNRSVGRIVLLEGIAMGVVSWALGTLLSLALSPLFSEQLGLALIKVPLIYRYSFPAAIAWFFVLQAIAVIASLGPARNAVRLTVREVLSYE